MVNEDDNGERTPPTKPGDEPMRVLVAEDDRATRMRILTFLKEWGYEGIEAADGAEAWAKFQSVAPSIVISDWLMPGMDGIELIRNIRSDTGDQAYHYTIILTSRSEMKDVVEGLEAGADDFVSKPFDKDELRVRVQAGERIIRLEHALEEQNLQLEASNWEITKSNQRMRESLLAAAAIQRSFLPPTEMEAGGTRFACCYEPCDELAGDTLNIIALDDRHVALYTIDVSGHGVPAALLSVHLSRILTRLRGPDAILQCSDKDGEYHSVAPAEILEQLNRKFMFDTENQQYFTMIIGVLDLHDRRFRYSSAGHPGPILLSGGRATVLSPTPPAVGLFPDPTFREHMLEFKAGDRLLFYTDGVYEATDDDGEEFGEHRLAESFSAAAGSGLGTALNQVITEARQWGCGRPFEDDISMLAAEIG